MGNNFRQFVQWTFLGLYICLVPEAQAGKIQTREIPACARIFLAQKQFNLEAILTGENIVPITPSLKLAIGHRPSKALIQAMAQNGFSAIVTLQGDHENAPGLGRIVEESGLDWIWVNIGSGRIPVSPEEIQTFKQNVLFIKDQISKEEGLKSIYLHCSAGIHRTGMYSLALMKVLGLSDAEAIEALGQARPLTLESLGADRIHFALNVFN